MKKVMKAGLLGLFLLCMSCLSKMEVRASQVQEPELTFEFENDFEAPVAEEREGGPETGRRLRSGTIPSSYDARQAGVVTGVKQQGRFETCWAVAASQMAESSLLSKQALQNGNPVSADTLDLSERHLAYFTLHTVTDPLGNTAGDFNEPLGADYLWLGGHPIFTTFARANWTGMADESKAPWSEILALAEAAEAEGDGSWPGWIEERTALPDGLAYETAAHMQNAWWINLPLNADQVKGAIMRHGGAVLPIYYESRFYQPAHAAYYNPQRTSENHSVFVVGWDDAYPASNFLTKPGRDGAWLVKNSYGEAWGEGGYFWLSYDDMAVTKSTGTAYVFDFEPADNYDHIYQYDGSAGRYIGSGTSAYQNEIPGGGAIGSVFQIPEGAEASVQELRAVSFSLLSANVEYSIQVYKNPSDGNNPETGIPMLTAPMLGSTSYAGYYTVPLTEPVALKRGDRFAVVVTLTGQNNGPVAYCADYSYQNGSWIRFHSSTAPGQSFVKNKSWEDLNAYGAAARLKAFTVDSYSYFTVEASVGDSVGGVVLGGGQVREGDKITLTAVADEGYLFDRWMEKDAVVGTEPELVIDKVDADHSFVAYFKQKKEENGTKEPEAPEPEEPRQPETPEPEAPESPEPEVPEPEEPEPPEPAPLKPEPARPGEPAAEVEHQQTVGRTNAAPDTGDTTRAGEWSLLLLASAATLAQLIRIKVEQR